MAGPAGQSEARLVSPLPLFLSNSSGKAVLVNFDPEDKSGDGRQGGDQFPPPPAA